MSSLPYSPEHSDRWGGTDRNEHWVNRWRAEAQTLGSGSNDGEDWIFSKSRTEHSESVKCSPWSIATRAVTIAIVTKNLTLPPCLSLYLSIYLSIYKCSKIDLFYQHKQPKLTVRTGGEKLNLLLVHLVSSHSLQPITFFSFP